MDLQSYAVDLASRAKAASRHMLVASGACKNTWLLAAAQAIEDETPCLLEANQKDVDLAPQYELTPAQVDRLRLTPARLRAAASGLREIAALPDPNGKILEGSVRPNGLQVRKVSVPLGVIFFIYESRPNVTLDAAGLCVKSGNAVILRGGKEALHSNTALYEVLAATLEKAGLPRDAVQLVNTTDRAVVGHLLQLNKEIDLAIPRGGESLIRRVVQEATMPVLKHYIGNCHVYVDRSADLDMALAILINAKCQRPGVCNAAESLLVHEDVARTFLPRAGEALREKGVELRGCARTLALAPYAKRATDEDYSAEFLDLILSVKVVDNIEDAVAHIARHGSGHTETIITSDLRSAERFQREVDSSAVMVNASTRFNDGFELGLGAEIGISTDKFHARGPCGLQELCTYKYLVVGDGHVRP